MDFELTEDQQTIRDGGAELAAKFDDQYWMEKDQAHEFPTEFYDAFAEGGWLGITTPEEYGGHGFGITEASILLEEVAASGAGMNGASSMHLSIFGMHPVIVHGSRGAEAGEPAADRQRRPARLLRRHRARRRPRHHRITTFARRDGDDYVVNGRKVWISKAHGVGEVPAAHPHHEVRGRRRRKTDGMTLFLTDLDRAHVDIRPITKMGRNAVTSNELFIDDLRDPGRGPRRRGGQGLQVPARRAQPRADAGRRRGARHRPRRAARARSATATSARCSAGRSARTRASSSRSPTRSPASTPRS